MLPVFDTRALFVASAVVFAGLVISVALAWRELKSLSGPDRFAKSYALFLVGLVLFSLQGQISPVSSYWLANVLVVVGAALVLEGTNLIFGRPPGNRPGRGTGLGLAFCRLAAEAQGGRIRLEHTDPGEVFAFSLPVAGPPAT